ncbi:MAG TPA: hypothetical protein VMW58_04590 [Anaerolineae bacterium]|nr:hypothetical protein [Anaerolineae bacterium]
MRKRRGRVAEGGTLTPATRHIVRHQRGRTLPSAKSVAQFRENDKHERAEHMDTQAELATAWVEARVKEDGWDRDEAAAEAMRVFWPEAYHYIPPCEVGSVEPPEWVPVEYDERFPWEVDDADQEA